MSGSVDFVFQDGDVPPICWCLEASQPGHNSQIQSRAGAHHWYSQGTDLFHWDFLPHLKLMILGFFSYLVIQTNSYIHRWYSKKLIYGISYATFFSCSQFDSSLRSKLIRCMAGWFRQAILFTLWVIHSLIVQTVGQSRAIFHNISSEILMQLWAGLIVDREAPWKV